VCVLNDQGQGKGGGRKATGQYFMYLVRDGRELYNNWGETTHNEYDRERGRQQANNIKGTKIWRSE
jgi:hypothetical protein